MTPVEVRTGATLVTSKRELALTHEAGLFRDENLRKGVGGARACVHFGEDVDPPTADASDAHKAMRTRGMQSAHHAYRCTASEASSPGSTSLQKASLTGRPAPLPTENSVSQIWRP